MPDTRSEQPGDFRNRYLKQQRSRLRVADIAARARASGIQFLWLLVVLAGAGVPLSEALDGPAWVGPSLGFLVVIAAGVQRIFSRTTAAAVASDSLRRTLAAERRRFLAASGPYAGTEDGFGIFVERSEAAIAHYDELMVDYGRTVAGDTSGLGATTRPRAQDAPDGHPAQEEPVDDAAEDEADDIAEEEPVDAIAEDEADDIAEEEPVDAIAEDEADDIAEEEPVDDAAEDEADDIAEEEPVDAVAEDEADDIAEEEPVDDAADDGADDASRSVVATVFENRTSLTIGLWRSPKGAEPLHVLRRGESVAQDTLVGDRWMFTDHTTGLELAPWTIDPDSTHLTTDADDVSALVSALAEEVAVVGGMAANVSTRFKNQTPFDIEVIGPSLAGGEVAHLCPVGHSIRIESPPVGEWRASTVFSTSSSGDVPAGIDLGRFLVAGEPVVHDIENTVIGFENRTMLVMECWRVASDGVEVFEATVQPMGYVMLDDQLADEWTIVDRRSKVELTRQARSWSPRLVEVEMTHLRPPAGAAKRQLPVRNDTAATVSFELLDEQGAWWRVSEVPPGSFTNMPTVVGGILRATERRTRAVLGAYIALDDNQEWTLRTVAATGATRVMELSNETHLTTSVVDLSSNEMLATLPPHGSMTLERPLGTPIAMCGIPPTLAAGKAVAVHGAIAVGFAQRLQPVMRPTSAGLRSRGGGTIVDVTVTNATGDPISVREVWTDGSLYNNHSIAPEAAAVIRTVDGWFLRVTRAGSDEILDEMLTTKAPAQSITATIASTGSGPEKEILLINRSLLTLNLMAVGTDGSIDNEVGQHTLAPGALVPLSSYVGQSWLARDAASAVLVHAFIVKRMTDEVELTTEGLVSHDRSDSPVELMAATTVAETVRIQQVGAFGAVHQVATLTGPGSTQIDSRYGRHYRAVAFDPPVVIAEFCVPNVPSAAWTFGVEFMRSVTNPSADDLAVLHPGEVAMYPQPNYGGTARVFDRSVGSALLLGAEVPEFGSIRFGPYAAATLTLAGTNGATIAVDEDLQTLDAPLAGADLSGLAITRLADTEHLGISRRSELVEDYRDPGSGELETVPVYRTSITVPPEVTTIDMTAERKVAVRWNDSEHQVHKEGGNLGPVRLRPDESGRVIFTIDATELSAPKLRIRTNTMARDEHLLIHPDATVHDRVANLDDGALHAARGELGIGDHVSEEQCGHVQTALQNLCRTVQHGSEPTRHGFQHHHRIGPENMSHPHWSLDMGPGGASYKPLTAAEVGQENGPSVQQWSDPDAQGLLDDIGKAFTSIGKIVVHTAEKVATDVGHTIVNVATEVGHTVETVANDVAVTTEHVGKDLVRGDLAGAMTDVAKGTLSVGKDVVTGALHVGGDLVDGAAHLVGDLATGAEQLVVATIHLAGEAFQFVLTHTGVIGELVGAVLEKIGAAIDKAVSWLMSKLGWDDIWDTFTDLRNALDPSVLGQRIKASLEPAEDRITEMFETFRTGIDHVFVSVENGLHLPDGRQHSRSAHHSDVMDKIEWMASHAFGGSATSEPPQTAMIDHGEGVHAITTRHIGQDDNLATALDGVVAKLEPLLTEGLNDPSAVVKLLLEAIQDVVDEAVSMIEEATHELFGVAEDAVSAVAADSAGTATSIPIVGALFKAKWGAEPSVLDLAALAVAVPLTIAHSAEHGSAPLDVAGALAAGPPPLSALQYTFGGLSATVQLIDGITAGISAFEAGSSAADVELTDISADSDVELTDISADSDVELTDISADSDVELTDIGNGPPIADVELTALGGEKVSLADGFALAMGIIAVITSMPVKVWTDHGDIILPDLADKRKAPEFWGDLLWFLQLFAVVNDAVRLTRKHVTHDPKPYFLVHGGLGAFQLCCAVAVGVADGIKADAVKNPTTDEDRRYDQWAKTPAGGWGLKLVGNILDTVPQILEITGPDKPKPVHVIDGVSHVAEGGILVARTVQNGLY